MLQHVTLQDLPRTDGENLVRREVILAAQKLEFKRQVMYEDHNVFIITAACGYIMEETHAFFPAPADYGMIRSALKLPYIHDAF